MEGVDFSYGSGTTVTHLKNAGKGFVCRYLSGGGSKDITRTEFTNYVSAGIAVVLVWETGASRMTAGSAAGKTDAQKADQQAIGLGAASIPVYFACDFDATPAQQASINAYLDGAASVIGRARVGIYGSYYVCQRARQAGKATYFWGTYAWSGGQWDRPYTHIEQYKNDTKIAGIPATIDLDRTDKTDFGQWPRPGGSAPAAPAPPSATVPPLHVDYMSTTHNNRAADVKIMQQRFLARGWRGIGTADGIFGPKTDKVVRQYQAEKHLTVDGKCGIQTWTSIFTAPVT